MTGRGSLLFVYKILAESILIFSEFITVLTIKVNKRPRLAYPGVY